MTKKPRIAKTKSGQEVYLGVHKVSGGWEGWMVGRSGYAVLVFIPAEG